MSEIDYLAKELKDTNLDYQPSKHLTWMLSVHLEELVPSSLLKHGMIGHTRKAARLMFVRYVTGRSVVSFKQLKPGEAVRIKRWIEGNGPSPNDDKTEEDIEINRVLREFELVDFWKEHRNEILNLAQWLKVTKR